jgi:DNA-binding NarL/FixJ family response regulator
VRLSRGLSSNAPIISETEWQAIAARLGIPPRQLQIVQAFVNGRAGGGKPEAIAKLLGIKPSSVRTHIARLYENLGVHDRVGVVVRVFAEVLLIRCPDR